MELAEALTQLRVWCDRSRGEEIEIAPGIWKVFESHGTHSDAAVREIEAALGFVLPQAYYEFMAIVGESSLFGWSRFGGGPHFYHPQQVIEVSREWAEVESEVERFCFIGEHRSMGDLMGFCIDRPDPNFDIFCHEYPPEEYVSVSDEIKSWREFGRYIVGVVATFGKDTL